MSRNGIRRPWSIEFVALGDMSVCEHAQRPLRKHRVDQLVARFDPDLVGLIILSFRDGVYWIVDGQHRWHALREWLGEGWEDQKIECAVHKGLTEAEEAALWLDHSNTLAQSTFDKFNVGLVAGRSPETEIAATVEKANLLIGKGVGKIYCVGALYKIYNRGDHEVLLRTLQIARDAWGDAGFKSTPLDGLSLVVQRYDGQLNDDRVVDCLRRVRAGLNGIMNSAQETKEKLGKTMALCVAGAIVTALNRSKGKKLPGWWKE